MKVSCVLSGIRHIQDDMGVCFTLIEGRNRALLFDAGYGMEDVSALIRSLTDKPVKVLLSHGHHDHILGARWFPEAWISTEDMEEFRERTGKNQRIKVMKQAKDRGVSTPEDFLSFRMPEPKSLRFTESHGPFSMLREDLGGMEAQVIRVPGHTPGSLMVFIPEIRLLLTGDDWNPCTWMWFPSSASAKVWRSNMLEALEQLEAVNGCSVEHVLCSHQPMLRSGKELKDYLFFMTLEKMEKSPAVDMGAPIRTHEIRKDPEGWQLVFDYDKLSM